MRFPRTILLAIAIAVIVSSFGMSQAEPAAAGSPCNAQKSRVHEPSWINVLNVRTGYVSTVKFRNYVGEVMASGEWPSHNHFTKLVAGAMATKQYAWYYVVNWRGGVSRGKCYHVRNDTGDQLWYPNARPTAKQKDAVKAVWDLRLMKWGWRFFLPGYRTGSAKACASDSNGWKLLARSAGTCARKGKSPVWIIKAYFIKTALRCSSKTAVINKRVLKRGERICKEP